MGADMLGACTDGAEFDQPQLDGLVSAFMVDYRSQFTVVTDQPAKTVTDLYRSQTDQLARPSPLGVYLPVGSC
jgi:hypothetical protein